VAVETDVGRALRAALGGQVREVRLAIGWSQDDLAVRAGVSRAMVGRVETGTVNVTLDQAGAICGALGTRVEFVFRSPFISGGRRQRDAAHARCVSYVQRRLTAEGWLTAREVEISHGRSHGWIDLLAFDPRTGRLLVIEVKTELHDVGQVERTIGWYEREAWRAARRLGWQARTATGLLLILATEAAETRLRDNRESLEAALPRRAPNILEGGPGRGLALIDPAGRGREWLLRARIDGRRSAAPYIDYADFMRRTAVRQAARTRSRGGPRRP
jgi:transcriptional regulator with XRE-family HTH domain